jgi:hypothetical protein
MSSPPILDHKDPDAPSVFAPVALLREARRQKKLSVVDVPPICILDPDGEYGGVRPAHLVEHHGLELEQFAFWAFPLKGYGMRACPTSSPGRTPCTQARCDSAIDGHFHKSGDLRLRPNAGRRQAFCKNLQNA